MKVRSMETSGSRSVPAPRVIILQERDIADHDEPRDGASAQTRFWARPGNYAWPMGVVAVGLGLNFYFMREMLVSLVLFSLLFFSLSLVVLSVFGICYAGNHAAIWASPASRAISKLFHQPDRGGAELARVPVVEEGQRLPGHGSEV